MPKKDVKDNKKLVTPVATQVEYNSSKAFAAINSFSSKINANFYFPLYLFDFSFKISKSTLWGF